MTVHQCDRCSAETKRPDNFHIGWSFMPKMEPCEACARKAFKVLSNSGLFSDELLKQMRGRRYIADESHA